MARLCAGHCCYMKNHPSHTSSGPLVANAVVWLVALASLALWVMFPNDFYRGIQEDGALEWTTFWAFLAAGVVYARHAAACRSEGIRACWFAIGLAAFCLLVAFEEISWGQRLLYFLPPDFLLEYNSQEEANLHNLAGNSTLHWVFVALVAAYGLALPLLSLFPPLDRWSELAGMESPPAWLVPAFTLTLVLTLFAPFSNSILATVTYSNEVIELLFGLCLLFSALALSALRAQRLPGAVHLVLVSFVLVILGGGSAAALESFRSKDQDRVALAQAELAALARDFYANKSVLPRSPGLELRLNNFVRAGNEPQLASGEFAQRAISGLMAPERAAYFLDPWNQPYWIADRYEGGERIMFLYSQGANARADRVLFGDGDDVIEMLVGHSSYFERR